MNLRTITGPVIDTKQNVLLSVHGSSGSVSGISRVRTTLLIQDQKGAESAIVLGDDIPTRVGHRVTAVLVRGEGDWQPALFRNHDLEETWRFPFDVAKDSAFTHFILAVVFGSLITVGGLATVHSGFELGRGSVHVAFGSLLTLAGTGWIYAAFRARTRPNHLMLARARQALASAKP